MDDNFFFQTKVLLFHNYHGWTMVLQKSSEICFNNVLKNTILTICRESLPHNRAIHVDALIGITLDDQEVLLIRWVIIWYSALQWSTVIIYIYIYTFIYTQWNLCFKTTPWTHKNGLIWKVVFYQRYKYIEM